MKLKFSGITRRPLLLSLVIGGGMIFVAVRSFGVAIEEILGLLFTSLLLVLLIALPAAALVAGIKLTRKFLRRNEEEE